MAPTNEITFHSAFIPVLQAGEYSVVTTQNITGSVKESFPSSKQAFYVDGPKFELEAGMVHHVYPAEGMRGDFAADVPSIIFNRVSLPWERKRENHTSDDESWLMLFMVDEEEKKQLEEGKKKAGELFGKTEVTDRYKDADVNSLKIPDSLTTFFPKDNEFKHLSYCRIGAESEEGGGSQHEKSVLLCNCLPKRGHINTVYVLSLEHVKGGEAGYKTYPCLYKWEFYCFDAAFFIPEGSKQATGEAFPEATTDTLFENSDEFEEALSPLKANKETLESYKSKYKFSGGTFHGLLQHLPGKLGSFSYPVAGANDFVRQGGVVLKEGEGNKGYRGPLQAAPVPLLLSEKNAPQWTGAKKYFPARTYQLPTDRSYQVAHELGVLTALKDEAFHKAFFEWKHEVSIALLVAQKEEDTTGRAIGHIPQHQKIKQTKPLPPTVLGKVEGWKKLKGIPYSYLVPSSKMLPNESIRSFCVDVNWVNAFLLGAFSIGNTYDSVEQQLFALYDANNLFLKANRFGFLIKSLVVGAWPDYEVDSNKQMELKLLERKKLAKNIELFLYEGDENTGGAIQDLTFHLPAGKTHSGFRYEADNFTKHKLPVTFHDNEHRCIKVCDLAAKAKADQLPETKVDQPPYFGMMMLEGTPKVEFNLAAINGETCKINL
jgi:hypothetical protein